MIKHQKLRDANAARQAEWDPGDFANNHDWRVNELAGETGEVCNMLKKIHRERCGVPGSRVMKETLAEELADVVICADLVALTVGIPADTLHARQSLKHTALGEAASLTQRGNRLAAYTGWLAENTFLPNDQNRPMRPDEAGPALMLILATVEDIAKAEGIDLWSEIVNKFNYTSRKMGLTTLLS